MREEKTHRLKYEVFRLVVIGVLILCIVFAVTMFIEFRMLIRMKSTIDSNTVFSEYYEAINEAETCLSRYVNARQEEQRLACIEAGKHVAQSSRQMRETFDDPQFVDHYYLTESWLFYYNRMILPDEENGSTEILEDYAMCEKLYRYLLDNENELNSIRTGITFRIYHEQFSLWRRQFAVMAAGILLCSAYLLIFSGVRVRRLVKPITDLTEQMQDFKNGAILFQDETEENGTIFCSDGTREGRCVETGTQRMRLPEETGCQGTTDGILVTETKILEHTFRDMSVVIRTQIAELLEKMQLDQQVRELQVQNMQMQVSLNEAHMKLIQSLLSPHFLFNCLNTVSGLAYFEHAPQTREASQLIACYLRDSIRLIGQNISLEEEIRHTREYMKIQELRFGERISFTIQSDGMNGEVKVPSMLLQPLVENAISHGLKTVWEGGRIEIKVQTCGGKVFLQVEDNGEGMDRTALEKVRADLKGAGALEKMTSLYGVAARLTTIYGNCASVEVNSEPGKGTRVSVTLETVPNNGNS